MQIYKHAKLSREDEVRFVSLMPGKSDDELSFSISHTILGPLKTPLLQKRLNLNDLRRSLPEGWNAVETLNGRYLFLPAQDFNTWNHPDPTFDRELHEPRAIPECEETYEALSYTWGSDSASIDAKVVDLSSPGRPTLVGSLKIRPNLASALVNLRYPDKTRKLWVDALCINQDDIEERNSQVRRLGTLFSQAHCVIIWLGEQSPDSKLAISTLEYLGDQVEAGSGSWYGDAPGAKEPMLFQPSYSLPYDDDTWASLMSLFSRPWFSRVWVLQEHQLANHRSVIQCGRDVLSWTAVQKAIRVLAGKPTVPSRLRQWLSDYKECFLAGESLERLLFVTRTRDCTNPRDRIYGILGLAPPAFAEKMLPHYAAATEDVYLDAFLANLTVSKQLDLLLHCRSDKQISGKPSWLPDWDVKTGSWQGLHRGWNTFSACGNSQAHFRLHHDQRSVTEMDLIGVRHTMVECVHVPHPVDARQLFKSVLACHSEQLVSGTYVTGGTLEDAFIQTLLQEKIAEKHLDLDYPAIYELRNDFDALMHDGPLNLGYQETVNVERLILFVTEMGHFGLAPPGLQSGDLVCVLLGCALPMLLRPAGPAAFHVVSPCFVHGMMDGEAVLGPLSSQWCTVFTYPRQQKWRNLITEELLDEDPRLPLLPREWEQIFLDHSSSNPREWRNKGFRNKTTGEILKSDPRLMPQSLVERGQTLETFRLI